MICMDERFGQLKTDLARRLAPVLPDVPTALFEELLDVIATMQYERESLRFGPAGERKPRSPADPNSTE